MDEVEKYMEGTTRERSATGVTVRFTQVTQVKFLLFAQTHNLTSVEEFRVMRYYVLLFD